MTPREFIILTQEEVYKNSTENGKEFTLRDVIFMAKEYHKNEKKDIVKTVSDWLMANTSIDVEKIVDLKELLEKA